MSTPDDGPDDGSQLATEPPKKGRRLEGIIESTDDKENDRPSITEVNGTVARFEMAYSPAAGERFAFGPPLRMRIPSLFYLTFALAIVGAVLLAHAGSSNSRLYVWVVEGDRGRPLGSLPLSLIVLLSAVGTVVRAGMRGVIVNRDGIEARSIMAMGFPRIRKWTWAQIDRLVMDEDCGIVLELWDGNYERLPEVREPHKLASLLEGIANARKKQVTRLQPLER